MQDFIGKDIERYHITEQIGLGGMAVVYKAYDMRLERDVALKLIRTEAVPQIHYERLMRRFEREAKAQARFSHPNIVPAYDYGVVDGVPFMVLAYMPGGTLKERIRGAMPVEEALSILIPITDAVAYAHHMGVLHRDIKPSNILFSATNRPMLTDFGIAKLLELNEETLTGTGLGVGTPEYMAPEQWQGRACEATDQYALGVVLYEMVTGKKPFTAETPMAVALKQMSDPLPRSSALNPSVPDALEKVLYKALAREPEERYADAATFKSVLVELTTPIEVPQSISEEDVDSLLTAVEDEKKDGDSLIATISAEIEEEVSVVPLQSLIPSIAAPSSRSYSESETFDRLDASVLGKVRNSKKRIGNIKRVPAWVLWTLGVLVVIAALIGGVSLLGREKNNPPAIAAISESTEQQMGEATVPQPSAMAATATTVLTMTATETSTHTPTTTPTLTPTPTPVPVVISVDNISALAESPNPFTGQHIAFSPDGKWIGVAQDDQALIYDAASLEQVRAFDADGPVATVGFSPDSQWFANGSTMNDSQSVYKLVLYDVETGELIYQFEDLFTYGTFKFTFSQDKKFLASSYKDGEVMLWDLETGKQRYPISAETTGGDFIFSPDENLLATNQSYIDYDNPIDYGTHVGYKGVGSIRIWRVETGIVYIDIEDGSRSMAFSPEGKILASGDWWGKVTFWQVDTGGAINQYYGYGSSVISVTFSPGGDLLASCSTDSKVLVWDVLTGRPIATLEPETESECTTVSFSPDGAGLYASYQDGTILSWGID